MAFNDIYRLVVHQRLHGQEVINKLHFVDADVTPGSRAQALADDFRAQMDSGLRGRCHLDMIFEYVEVQRIVPYGDGPVLSNWPASTTGTYNIGSACLPGSVAEVITIYTGQAGRRKRGRQYLTGINASNCVAGVYNSAQTARTVTYATALSTRYIGTVPSPYFRLGVWSRLIAGPIPPWTTDAFAPASAITVRTISRNQRRRQVGVGR